jgi:hypothetical protein
LKEEKERGKTSSKEKSQGTLLKWGEKPEIHTSTKEKTHLALAVNRTHMSCALVLAIAN